MNTRLKMVTVFNQPSPYWRKLISEFGTNLTALYRLDETSGTTAIDSDGGYNGTYTGITLANATGPSGKLIAYSDGTAGRKMVAANVPVVGEGGFGGWIKQASGEWATGVSNYWAHLFGDASNRVIITKSAGNQFGITMIRGGVNHSFSYDFKADGFYHFFITWSEANNRIRYYLNTMLIETDTTIGTWGSATVSLRLFSNDGASPMKGWEDTWALIGGVEPTQAQINLLGSATHIYRMSIFGDSISASGLATAWPNLVNVAWKSGTSLRINHAVASMGIVEGVSNMAVQVAAAASDNSDAGLFLLGANDDNAGNMTTLQAAYESGLASYKANNPNGTIVAMTPLPSWTDTGGGTEVDKSNIRTAIAAACTARGQTVHDLYTDALSAGFTAGTHTTDGTHLTTAGYALAAGVISTYMP